jgi:hypothetical protein
MLLFMFPLIFVSESADANITRSCTAKYTIYIETPAAIRGSHFDTRDFSGKGGCGAVVPNRCRDRASEKLIACFRAQFSNINAVPAECTSAHNVHDYPFRVSLQRYLQETVCGRYEGHREITVHVNPSIRGNRHCDCNPWSDRVLDCTGSGPIRLTCPVTATIVPGVIDIEPVQMYPVDTQDDTPPTVSITGPTSSPTYNTESTPLALSGNASDAEGVTQVTWANDRGGSGACAGTTNWNCAGISLSIGTNNVTVTAEDAARNRGTDRVTVTYTEAAPPPPGDTIPPEVTIRTPSPSATPYEAPSNRMMIVGSASDNVGVAAVRWSNDRGGSGACDWSGTLWTCRDIMLSDGLNVITITAEDTATPANTGSARLDVNYTPRSGPGG